MTKKIKKNSRGTKLKTDAFADALNGLVYISERDADILPFNGDEAFQVTAEEIRRQTGTAIDVKIEIVDPKGFFERLTTIREWFGDVEKERAARFLKLNE